MEAQPQDRSPADRTRKTTASGSNPARPASADAGRAPGRGEPPRPEATGASAGGTAASPPPRPPTAIDLGGGAWIARGDLRWTFSRSSGPGGQNVNKVNTRAELRVAPGSVQGLPAGAPERLAHLARSRMVGDGSLSFAADATRSQVDNREACLDRLRELIALALVVPRRRRKTRRTKGSNERRIAGKKRDSERKRNRGWSGDG